MINLSENHLKALNKIRRTVMNYDIDCGYPPCVVDGAETDEANFRYPGPKPRSREAGIMMLADAVESASRSLEDPAPARIEGLVRKISKKRLDAGQFHDCGLTLQELHAIENSLIKSLAAVHHGRVKYPDQEQTA